MTPMTGDPAPRYVGTLFLQRSWDLFHSLPDDLKVSYHRILCHRRVHEPIPPIPGIVLNLFY
jgi:hypothetical protein